MKLDDDDFTLFGLPERHALDRAEVDARWRQLQAEVHPDRFAGDGAAAQRIAMQWAVRVNEAYQRLKDPLRRAAYLCERRGAAIQAHDNTAMPAATSADATGGGTASAPAEPGLWVVAQPASARATIRPAKRVIISSGSSLESRLGPALVCAVTPRTGPQSIS